MQENSNEIPIYSSLSKTFVHFLFRVARRPIRRQISILLELWAPFHSLPPKKHNLFFATHTKENARQLNEGEHNDTHQQELYRQTFLVFVSFGGELRKKTNWILCICVCLRIWTNRRKDARNYFRCGRTQAHRYWLETSFIWIVIVCVCSAKGNRRGSETTLRCRIRCS